MYNVIEFEFSKIRLRYRQTCAPLLKLEGACVPSFLGPRFESIQRCLTQAGPSVPPPLKSWEGHVSPPLPPILARHVINSEMSDINRVTCAPLPFLKLWEGHVLPSPFPLLIHSEMFHRLGHLCPPLSKVKRGTCPLLSPILAGRDA